MPQAPHSPNCKGIQNNAVPENSGAWYVAIAQIFLGLPGFAIVGGILWEARHQFELLSYFESPESLGIRSWFEAGWREVYNTNSLLISCLLHAVAAAGVSAALAWKRGDKLRGREAIYFLAPYLFCFAWGWLLLILPLSHLAGFHAPNFMAQFEFDDYQAIWNLSVSGMLGLIGAFLARTWLSDAEDSSSPASRSKNRVSVWTLAAIFACFIYFVGFTTMTLLRHWTYHTAVHDLGFNAQAIWSLGNGYGWRVTSWGDYFGGNIYNQLAFFDYSFLGEHYMPILYLLAPFTKIFPPAEILIVAQSAAIAAAGLMLFLFVRDHLGSSALAAALAISFLLHPSIHEANLKDFHADALQPFFLFSALWFWSRKSLIGYAISLAAFLACKEDAGLVLITLGIFFLLGRQWYFGVVAIVMGFSWFYIANNLIISPMRGGAPVRHLYRYAHLAFPAVDDATLLAGYYPGGIGDLARGFFTNPWAAVNPQIRMTELGGSYISILTHERLRVILLFSLPVGFIFLRSWRAPILIAIPVAAALLSNWDHNYRFRMHYGIPSIQWAYIAGVMGMAAACMKKIEGKDGQIPVWRPMPSRRFVAAWSTFILVATIHTAYHYGRAPGMKFFDLPTYQQDEAGPHADHLLRLIPDEVPVAADNTLGPHLANRPHLMLFPQIELSTLSGEVIQAEWIMVDVSAHPWPLDRHTRRRVVVDILQNNDYGVWANEGDPHGYYAGVILLERGRPPTLNAATLAQIP